ncbi:hypothetical protein BGX28_007909 [Mortierella sp. GBA30]|nr:hypothetical protein BGX28_007909 [Mortierella sp. GBA30]
MQNQQQSQQQALQTQQQQLQEVFQQQQEQLLSQQQQQLDWRQTLPTEERLDLIRSLSDLLKSLSPTITERKILDLAKTFENVTYQRSSNKASYSRDSLAC